MGRIDEALRRTGVAEAPGTETPGGMTEGRYGQSSHLPTAPWVFPSNDTGRSLRDEPVRSPQGTPQKPPATGPGSPLGLRENGALGVFQGFNPAVSERLVVKNGSTSAALAEQFRKLAATLHHAQITQGTRVVMVTSGMAADGKSLTATNLALTLSESYRRQVVLIDADLRRPSLHEIFQVPNVSGLNEGLQADADEKLSTLRVSETLTLLPAGRPNADPMSGLTSARMRSIIDEASAHFHWVVIDTPPIGLLADANLLADMVDGVLLVIQAERTPHAVVNKAVDVIGRDRILGVVLNNAKGTVAEDAYYHRYAD